MIKYLSLTWFAYIIKWIAIIYGGLIIALFLWIIIAKIIKRINNKRGQIE